MRTVAIALLWQLLFNRNVTFGVHTEPGDDDDTTLIIIIVVVIVVVIIIIVIVVLVVVCVKKRRKNRDPGNARISYHAHVS